MNEEMTELNPDELDLLQSRLVADMQATGCMPLDVAHGFLSATAAAADSAESALLDRTLGQLADDSELRPLMTRFRRRLIHDLRSAEYGPLILQMPRDDGSMLPLPYGWCQGYMGGIEFLGEDRRDTLLADEQAGALLTPVLSFLMYDEAQWFDPPNETAHRETVAELGNSAVGIYQWWGLRNAS